MGIEQYSWLDRFEHIIDRLRYWFLDLARTDLSVKISTLWFARRITFLANEGLSILIFSHHTFMDGA